MVATGKVLTGTPHLEGQGIGLSAFIDKYIALIEIGSVLKPYTGVERVHLTFVEHLFFPLFHDGSKSS